MYNSIVNRPFYARQKGHNYLKNTASNTSVLFQVLRRA